MKKDTLSFQEAAQISTAPIGGKAASLLRLRQSGFLVPDGFIVTADAYTRHLKRIGLRSAIGADFLEEIRTRIIRTPMDPATAGRIADGYRTLAAASTAVRSSSAAEDLSDHSFAGQYETYLNVGTVEECLQKIQHCWASVWTQRAFSYRQKNGIDHAAAAMAVIVQPMVKADCAGVIFTQDPITGDNNRVLIESCPGLGDKLVSGAVTPDLYTFDKSNSAILCMNPSKSDTPVSLDEAAARRLAAQSIEIERTFGAPQDIEWAMEGGQLFFLQSRPITTRPKDKSFEERQVWTNMNTAEILPDVVTPLTWSILNKLLKPLFRSVVRMLGADMDDQMIAGLVAGRVYFNVNTGVAIMRHFPPFIQRQAAADELLGGNLRKEMLSGRLTFQRRDLPDVKGSLWKFLGRIPQTLHKIYHHRPSQSVRRLEELRAFGDQLRTIDLAEQSDSQLCGILCQTMKQTEQLDLLFVGLALMHYPFLRLFCKHKFADTNGNIAHQLIRGQSGMEDVQAGFDLWKIAETANQSEVLRRHILSCRTFDDFARAVIGLPQGQAFLNEWNQFMDAHGHHCRGEIELFNPRWSEQPDYILSLVKNYMSGMDTVSPIQSWNELERRRDDLMHDCLEKLHPMARFRFRRMVEKTRIGLVLRENWKSYLVRVLVQMRRVVLELGRRLHAADILTAADDIFFMTLEEIRPAAEYNDVSELRKTIQARRDEYERNKKLSPPHIVVGCYRQDAHTEDNVVAGVLKGLSVCPGRVTGKARIILRADDNEQVLAGEILIAPFTDPAWTPYFLTAAAIVMDQGGMLSHGSVVAREYGIPAVVNVGPATRVIKTGQLIEVDADQGIVRILS